MSQKNNSQQEEIISASELNEGDDRYKGLLEMMGMEEDDTPSSAPSNRTFVSFVKMALHPLEAVARKGQSL